MTTMASAAGEAPGAATVPYSPVAPHELRRQASMPAALASALIAPCGGSRDGTVCWDDGSGDDAGPRVRVRAPRQPVPAGGGVGVGAAVRALWAWVARGGGRKKAAVMSRSGSSSSSGAAKERQRQQYGHEEYAQNFDEGGAAREPENLSRSFSARYAYARRAPWGAAAR